MATGKWFKDSCPYCKDQGFDSVIGDVESGESVFGFTHTMASADDIITFATETSKRVSNMANTDYKVLAIRTKATSEAAGATQDCVYDQHRAYFHLVGESGKIYDVIVRGRILY